MPHLMIEYSANLDKRTDLDALCRAMRETMMETGIFPEGGIRVRTFAASHWSIADNHPDNAFAHMTLRIGQGRPHEDRRRAGDMIMDRAKAHFADELSGGFFALSLELIEIDGDFSWKENAIHPRLKAASS